MTKEFFVFEHDGFPSFRNPLFDHFHTLRGKYDLVSQDPDNHFQYSCISTGGRRRRKMVMTNGGTEAELPKM